MAERALPPSSLNLTRPDFGYERYEVLKPFDMKASINAPGFGQPGGGMQFEIDAALLNNAAAKSVEWLIKHGFLAAVKNIP